VSTRASPILLLSLLTASACGEHLPVSPFEHLRPVCHQTYEFSNYGCAVISGQVVGARGQPLRSVDIFTIGTGGNYDTPYTLTDAAGEFSLQIHRYDPPGVDSGSAWVRATVFLAGTPTHVDSVFVRFRLAPVGQIPDTARAVVTLDVP